MASSAKGVSPLDSLFLSRIEHIISKEQWLTKDPTSDLRQASRARYRPTLCAARPAAAAGPSTTTAPVLSVPDAPRCSRHKPMILALVLLLLLICVVLVGSAQAPRREEEHEEA